VKQTLARFSAWAGGALLALALIAGALLRLWVARHDDGVFWPDEIYQSLEPAHRVAFGYGLIAWEFLRGARQWALPGLIAALMRLAVRIRGDAPQSYLPVIRLFFCAVGVLTGWTIFRLGRALKASPLPAAIGATTFLLMNMAVYFAPRAMSETASVPLLALGLAWAVRKERQRWQLWAGASLLGIAVFVRFQSGFYCLGLLVLLLAQRRRREALEALVVLSIWALIFGLVDKLTWGNWFHSAIEYVRFNVVEGKSGNFGREPIAYYARVLWTALGPLLVALIGCNFFAIRRAVGVMAMPLVFCVIHSFILHKEVRFLFPAVALFCATGAVGLEVLLERARHGWWIAAFTLTVAASVASAASTPSLTFGKLGLYERPPGVRRAMDDGGPENRLLMAAYRQDDLCGLLVMTRQLGWTGGYAYLHRRVPLYEQGQVPDDGDTFNYAIASIGSRPGEAVATDSGLALIRLSHQGCRPDPGFDWHLH
jgi:phosphatidylinositol glycan class B